MSKRFNAMAFIALLFIFGCEAKKIEKSVPDLNSSQTLSDAAMLRLDEADKLDGTADHVVGKCYVCSLGMDGSEKFAVQADGYTCRLCSKSCQREFEKSKEDIILSTNVPKETKPE